MNNLRAVPQIRGRVRLPDVEAHITGTVWKFDVEVGDLVGWVGDVEVRSAFSGTLGGLLVIAGERVMPSQPLAWLRASGGD